ncbi:MAG: hypothetical protein GY913_21570 [Proteobacteria bacterium]|nr:hypothetical protein [Actinomycetes bacterium]MCP4919499.1 hypothetical protein [Pseudomonadota bacterium]
MDDLLEQHLDSINQALEQGDRSQLAKLAGLPGASYARNVSLERLAARARRRPPRRPAPAYVPVNAPPQPSPKSATHANRGMELEEMLRLLHRRYREQGACYVQKTNPRVVRGKDGRVIFADEAEPDYHGLLRSTSQQVAVLFEAKQTSEARWHILSQLHEHQARAFDLWEDMGGYAFVLLMLGDRIHLVTWGDWGMGNGMARLYHELAAIKAAGGRPTRGTASLSAEWLEENAVVVGHRAVSVDWLQALEF